ncbi:MAG: UTRA domain-containing protein [Acetobacterium woodii]|nr:UTRA domain-containing protein [Acetobacterium woodii]
MIDEGYIYSIPGKGNYVLEKNNDKYLISLKTERLLKKPYQRVELLGSEIIKPTIDLVYHLRIAPDSRVVYIRWILLDDEKPIAYDIQYIPYFPGITVWNDNFEYTSFSEILSQKNKLFQMRGEMNVSGINCEREIAEILKIPVETPVMQITQKILDDDEPMGFRQLFIRREWCCIRGTSHRE